MKVQIIDKDGKTIWERGENQGMTSTAYRTDGTGQKIIEALTDALENAKAQLGIFDEADVVANVGLTTA